VFSFIASAIAEQSTYEAGLSKVIDSLEQTVLSGDDAHTGSALGRKLYVQQMLKLALKSPALSAGAKTYLKQAKMKLEDILAEMTLKTVSDQAVVDQIRMAFDHCADAWSTATGHGQYNTAHNTAVTNTKSAHDTCRREEQTAIGAVTTACSTYQTNANDQTTEDVGDYSCDSGIAESDLIGDRAGGLNSQAISHYYGQWNTWFTNQQTHYDDVSLGTDAGTCETNYNTWSAKNGVLSSYAAATTCGHMQLKYEEAFCARKVQFTIRCEQNYACHAYYQNEYSVTHAQVQVDESQRLRDAAMITYAICLLDEIANDSGNQTVEAIDSACNTYLDDDYTGLYGNNFTALPAAEHADNCTDQSWYTETDTTDATNWYAHLLASVQSDGSTFSGPFRPPTAGLCASVFSYASRGPAYYIRVTDATSTEYWHNESLVGSTR